MNLKSLYNVVTMEEATKESPELSTEFKNEIKTEKKKNNWLTLGLLVLICLAVFGALGVGAYDIFIKSDAPEQKNSAEKIESKPVAETEKTEKEQAATPTISETTPAPEAQSATPQEYTVQDGDVLGSIATKFDTTVEKLKAANNIEDETLLQIGQKIKIVK